jgi:hypothetical protein
MFTSLFLLALAVAGGLGALTAGPLVKWLWRVLKPRPRRRRRGLD